MAVAFPSIKPTSRSFSAPRWPITSATTQNGVTIKRLWGSQPSKAELELSFENITDANAAAILAAYDASQGGLQELTLPSAVFSGASSTLTGWLSGASSNANLRWYFSEESPPSVESVFNNRSNVTVRLIAELRV